MLTPDAERDIPVEPLFLPVVQPRHLIGRWHEELELHLLELAKPEDRVAGRDLVTEGLPDLRDAKRRAHPRRVQDVGEVDEDALGRFRTQVDLRARILGRAHEGLEHQVELPGLGELSPILLVTRPAHLVGPKTLVTFLAFDQRVGEVLDVTGGHPDLGVHDDAGVDANDVVAQLDDAAPPGALDVVAQRDAQRPEVVDPLDAAVDLARLIDEAAALRQGHELLH